MQYSRVCSTVECAGAHATVPPDPAPQGPGQHEVLQVAHQVCNTVLNTTHSPGMQHCTTHSPGMQHCTTHYTLTRYAALYYTLHTHQVWNTVLHTTHSQGMQLCTTHLILHRALRNLHYTLHTLYCIANYTLKSTLSTAHNTLLCNTTYCTLHPANQQLLPNVFFPQD